MLEGQSPALITKQRSKLDAQGSKEADTLLLRDLKRDFDSTRRFKCFGYKCKRSKTAVVVLALLIVVMLILSAVSVLTFKAVFPPASALELCSETASFVLIPLGTNGGITEDNLSAYLLSRRESPYFLVLDAGDMFHGLQMFVEAVLTEMDHKHRYSEVFTFPDWAQSLAQKTGWILKNHIVGYFIGHPHLDHLTGLVAAAPEDYYSDMDGNAVPSQPKSIIGLNSTLSAIESDLFNGVVWSDFAKLGRYSYKPVVDGEVTELAPLLGNFTQGLPLAPTDFPNNITVKTHQICHDTLNSSAFLFTFDDESQLVFFSDTGVPSSVPASYCDWTARIANVWRSVNLPHLKLILIEVSFPNAVPDSGMFGHLRPKDLMQQLHVLASMNNVGSLEGLTVIVEHIKPILGHAAANDYNSDARSIIQHELAAANDLHVNFVFPVQGAPICI